MPLAPEKIRNVAVVGHRGTGKTSLVEAMLFQAGATNRLGTVEAGSTVSDWDEDEQRRQMSLAASLCHLEWGGLKINLIDTPGDAGFQGDAIASLRVVEGAAELADEVEDLHTKLLDSVVETDEALMERYLEGEELSPEEVATCLKAAVTRGEIFPVACGVATKNLGTTALLDLLAEGIPSPADKEAPVSADGASTAAFVFKTIADPFAGRINVFRVMSGTLNGDSTLVNTRAHAKERVGQLLELQGKEHQQTQEFGPGDIGAVAKLKETMTGDLLLDAEREVETPELGFPEPVMSFAVTPKSKGDEEKVATSLRRLAEEGPTPVLRPDSQTGEQLLSGFSQIHVEVAVDRRRRHPAELPARRRQGHPGGDAARRPCLCAGAGRARAARRRLVPQRRLVGDRVQDRRLARLQERLREGRSRPPRADYGARGDRSRRIRGRGQRRPQLTPRAASGDGAAGRHDEHQGRGADGRHPHVLAVADLAHRRPGRLPHALPPLRGGAAAHRPEGDRRGREGEGRGEGLSVRARRARRGSVVPARARVRESRRRPRDDSRPPFAVRARPRGGARGAADDDLASGDGLFGDAARRAVPRAGRAGRGGRFEDAALARPPTRVDLGLGGTERRRAAHAARARARGARSACP